MKFSSVHQEFFVLNWNIFPWGNWHVYPSCVVHAVSWNIILSKSKMCFSLVRLLIYIYSAEFSNQYNYLAKLIHINPQKTIFSPKSWKFVLFGIEKKPFFKKSGLLDSWTAYWNFLVLINNSCSVPIGFFTLSHRKSNQSCLCPDIPLLMTIVVKTWSPKNFRPPKLKSFSHSLVNWE